MKKSFYFGIAIVLIFLGFYSLFRSVNLGKDKYIGRVSKITDEVENNEYGVEIHNKKLRIKLENGKEVNVVTQDLNDAFHSYKVGDKVIVNREDGNYFFVDHFRIAGILFLVLIFVVISVVVAGKFGIYSLISMGFSFLIIFKIILPGILEGDNPILTVIKASILIIPVTFYLSHGLNSKTTISIVGTIIAMLITVFLADVFIHLAYLNGYSSEEAYYLNFSSEINIYLRGLLLAGIIVSLLGILDDVTVSQVNTVYQLNDVNKGLSNKELFFRGLSVGRDHISSTINTLVLVYTGTAFPLLLMFVASKSSVWELINQEFIATEIAKTLIGRIGLITAIPIVTLLAVLVFKRKY